MSLLLKDRDYVADGSGGVTVLTGAEALLGEVLFRLTARRGSFPFLPRLGSRMYQLLREKPSARTSLARQYAAEALADLTDLTVTGAEAAQEGDKLYVTVALVWKGTPLTVTSQWEE